MNRRELADLRHELKTGKTVRLSAIFKENSGFCLTKLTRRYSCSREDAEDIYVDAVLAFRENLITGRIQELTSVRSYLYSVCKNMLLVKLKDKQRESQASNELQHGQHETETDHDFIDQLLHRTEEGLNMLPEKCREILKAFYFDKMSMEEIAGHFSFASVNVAKVSKSRCFKKLVDAVRGIEESKKIL